jgi:hypothetical protein
VTARRLHALPTEDPAERYDGGRPLRRPDGVIDGGWAVDSKFGDVHLTLTGCSGRVASTLTADLDDGDVDDLILALSMARSARETYRANELRRNG